MKNNFIYLILLFSTCAIISCNKDNKENKYCDNQTSATKESIQGTWIHAYPENGELQPAFTSPTRYKIRFVNDSFFLSMQIYTDALTPNCSTDQIVYYKGVYSLQNDKLSLDWVQTSSNWDPNEYDSCYFRPDGIREPGKTFGISFCNETLVLEDNKYTEDMHNGKYWHYIEMTKE